MTEVKKKRSVFISGEIDPAFIAESIAKHRHKKEIGAHSLFLGQVREDLIDGKKVTAIDYTAYAEMAEEKFAEIREETFAKFPITCMHIYHSLGRVEAGGISLFVFTSSPRREAATEACRFVVEKIKGEVPVWGKEELEDGRGIWKENSKFEIRNKE